MQTQTPLTRDRMVALMLADDAGANGRFVVAVKTTGIYCLPSCRPPRKPKPENVTFYATPAEARAAGFRPCKLCRPDAGLAGPRHDEALVEKLVAAVGRDPGAYRGVGDLAAAAAVGAGRLHELVRTHYHASPADLLTRARVAAAKEALLHGRRPVAEIAFAVGFDSLSAFNDNFRKQTALSPLAYRRLPGRDEFVLALPADYPLDRVLAYLGRDRGSLTDRVDGRTHLTTVRLDDEDGDAGEAAIVRVDLVPGAARCRILAGAPRGAAAVERLHRHLLATLGLGADPARFEAHVSALPALAPLIDGQRGLRVPLVADPFDGLVRAIVGQQITLGFAATLRRRLIERVGAPLGDGLFAPPMAAAVAALETADLAALGFSRAKAGYLVDVARSVAEGRLPLAAWGALAPSAGSATRLERTLLAVRGIGPWSANYLMMRSYGFLDCVPLGDTGLTAGLQRFFALPARPGKEETIALMRRFSPYRSLATFHLWQRHGAAA
jgi:AraC family transcriptional regulator of adaptative response / DNA-3-methyladenine glycosylase II